MNSIVLTEVKDVQTLGAQVVQAMQSLPDSPKRILRFDGFILARVETNKNRDRITAENLNELAATLPLNWIDLGHDTKKRVGFYIDAKVVDGALPTSGIIWTDDDPTIPQKLATGELQSSLEADADKAECSICHKTFASEKEYCEHLAPFENRFRFQSERILYGMKATGGALVTKPAGTDTKADPARLQMIANVVMAADHAPVAPPEPPKPPELTAEQIKARVNLAKNLAAFAAQQFFATEWANTPVPYFVQTVSPVISPLTYHAEPELTAAPIGKHPVQEAEPATPVQEAAAQAQQAAENKIEAAIPATARMGSLSWLPSSEHAPQSTVAWK